MNAFDAEVFTAACDAAAELAFIDPESIVPLITASLRADLDPAQLEHIGPTETAIFRTPEGTAFVDVLSTKPQERKLEKGNNKDYDVLKWEQEVRDQIARKSGEQRKLSEEDQTKLKAQLIKEGQIRGLVREVEQKLHRGIGYISSLTRGPPSDTEAWMAVASDNLISTIAAGAGLLVGDKAAFAYLACASMITPRLGSLRPFVGIATLRGQGISQLPNELTTEGLGGVYMSKRPGRTSRGSSIYRSHHENTLPAAIQWRAEGFRQCLADLYYPPDQTGAAEGRHRPICWRRC